MWPPLQNHMKAVTTKYYANRRYSVSSLIPWWCRNEIANNGYLTVNTNAVKRKRFSILKWLNPDIYSSAHYEEMPRYRESDFVDDVRWDLVKNPWEKDEPQELIEPQFHDIKEKTDWLENVLPIVKCEKRGILFPLCDTLPIGWSLKNGKITLY